MTSLREAAQAALDALDGVADIVPFITVCKNLRAALAEPEPTPEQTPVVWQLVTPKGLKEDWISMLPPTDDLEWRPLYAHGVAGDERRHVICLCPDCAHPAPAQTPMTDEDIQDLYRAAMNQTLRPRDDDPVYRFARAVEAFHKIGVPK